MTELQVITSIRRLTPVAQWCECDGYMVKDIFSDDFMCACGVEKHHYHCYKCKKLTQIG